MSTPLEQTVKLTNELGMHLRTAGRFVELAGHYAAQITVTHDGVSADGKSIMSLLALGVSCGEEITISGTGDEASEAVAALAALVARRFDEDK